MRVDADDDETPRSGFDDTKSDDSTHGGDSDDDDDDDAISGVSGASYDEEDDEVPFAPMRHAAAESKDAKDRQARSLDLMRRLSYQGRDVEQGELSSLFTCYMHAPS